MVVKVETQRKQLKKRQYYHYVQFDHSQRTVIVKCYVCSAPDTIDAAKNQGKFVKTVNCEKSPTASYHDCSTTPENLANSKRKCIEEPYQTNNTDMKSQDTVRLLKIIKCDIRNARTNKDGLGKTVTRRTTVYNG